MDNNESSLQKMQLIYIESLDAKFDLLENFIFKIEKGSKELIEPFLNELHSLKGSTAVFDIKFIINSINQIEDFLSLDGTLDEPKSLDKIYEVLKIIRTYSKSFLNIEKENEKELFQQIMNILDNGQKKKSVLINGDFPLLNKKIQNALSDLDVHISFCRNGYEALGRVINERFDLLITSYQSEIIKGTNLAKMIKANEDINTEMKLILLTSKEHSKDTGIFTCVLQKDADIESNLRQELLKLFGN
jgi:CheY-like chemotaxis protein